MVSAIDLVAVAAIVSAHTCFAGVMHALIENMACQFVVFPLHISKQHKLFVLPPQPEG
jgi:hypothetical protein